MATCNEPLPLARTPLHALHAREADSEWVTLGDSASPARLADASSAPSRLARCGLIDFSALARTGLRGAGAADALGEQGYRLPEAPNRCQAQPDGRRVVRLSATEYLLLADRQATDAALIATQQQPPGCYVLPRQDSHAWLALTGEHAAAVMAKLCAVDLAEDAFPVGQVAQTSVARVDAIVIRDRLGDTPCLHLLVDSAAAGYLWPALLDAMQEFDGGPLGIDSLVNSPSA